MALPLELDRLGLGLVLDENCRCQEPIQDCPLGRAPNLCCALGLEPSDWTADP
jgi:hypothetical protein